MSPTPTSAHLQALQVVDEVIGLHRSIISTHYEGCYVKHAACLAALIRDILEES